MRKFLLFIFISFMICSCSHRINRIGYNLKRSDYRDCELPIKIEEKADSNYKKIGEIIFGDCKYSRIRSKEEVLNVVRKEGCSIGAELAIIQTGDTAKLGKPCFECRAAYYAENRPLSNYLVNQNINNSNNQTHKRAVEIGIAMLTIFVLLSIIIRV